MSREPKNADEVYQMAEEETRRKPGTEAQQQRLVDELLKEEEKNAEE